MENKNTRTKTQPTVTGIMTAADERRVVVRARALRVGTSDVLAADRAMEAELGWTKADVAQFWAAFDKATAKAAKAAANTRK